MALDAAAARRDRAGDQRRRQHLPRARDRVEQPGRQLVHHRQSEAELLESIEPSIDLLEGGGSERRHRG